MPKQRLSARATTHHRHRLSTREKNENKRRVLTHDAPSVTSGIADAVVVKNGDLHYRWRNGSKVGLADGENDSLGE